MKVIGNTVIVRLVFLACLAAPAMGADRLALMRAGDAPDTAGIAIMAPGTTSADQFIILRYRAGSSFPAGQIIGYGPGSILTGTANTTNQSTKAIVITEGVGSALSQWQTTSKNCQPAILQPRLADLTIAGYSTNNWTSGGAVNDNPQTWNQGAPYLYGGALLEGVGGEIHNVEFFYIPGIALEVGRSWSVAAGAQQPFDRVRWTIDRICSHRVFAGPWIRATDSSCNDVETFSFRDFGFRLGGSGTGAIQSHTVHCYGGGYSGEQNGSGGAAIWIDGDSCQCERYYGESAPIGLLFSGSKGSLKQFKSHTCSTANLKITGNQDVVTDLDVDATVVGVDIEGQYNTLRDGWIRPKGSGKAIVLGNGTGQVIDNIGIGAFGQSSAIGIEPHATLTNCRITAQVIGGARGIDLDYGGVDRVGEGTVIHITSANGTTNPVRLHMGWSTTPTTTTKEVVINGTRYYPP